ncbi:hypothetical protein MCOR25_006953 [Pyricularia grisea]|uniref:CFEM domain-containing protein n=1 Tax=Pyricularia grisea TaxID=148305 RepID=A0A6P8B2Z2_PYRGI|nr:uncharacterized protein PgNI_07910 [Pyricularia grisea]KAI6359781.1 hypothetical protein MCOR25_006953 [Pyricularia grisea]TLD09174.1 hypothetical protein PgNI_07910 [Pyricularia grisea]
MRIALLLVSLAASLVLAQDINPVPACGQGCFNSMKGKLGCAAADQKCLCDKADYRNGLRDCVTQSCGSEAAAAQSALNVYVDAVCAAASTSAAAATSTPPAASTPASTTPHSTSAPPTSTPAPTTTAASTTPSSTAAPAVTTTSSSSTSSSTITSSTTSTSATSSATAAPAASEKSAEGLSSTARIGIAAGGAVAALGLIGVLVCVFLHRRNQRRDNDQTRRLKISEPMPGAGRTYAGDHFHDKYQSNSPSDVDFKSRRYEDMLPRQTPRNMV